MDGGASDSPSRTARDEDGAVGVGGVGGEGGNKETGSVEEEPPEGMKSKEREGRGWGGKKQIMRFGLHSKGRTFQEVTGKESAPAP